MNLYPIAKYIPKDYILLVRKLYYSPQKGKYVKSENLTLTKEDFENLEQPPNTDYSLYPLLVHKHNQTVHYPFLFLDIDYAPKEKDLHQLIDHIYQHTNALPLYLAQTSPQHYQIAYLLETDSKCDSSETNAKCDSRKLTQNVIVKELTQNVIVEKLTQNVIVENTRPLHEEAKMMLMGILDKYEDIKVDQQSFNYKHPHRLIGSYNYKRQAPTFVIKEYKPRALRITPIELSTTERIKWKTERTDKRPNQNTPKTLTPEQERELKQWIELFNILGIELEFRQSRYAPVNCIFHPPDHHPSAQVFIGSKGIFYYDFHDNKTYTFPQMLKALLLSPHLPQHIRQRIRQKFNPKKAPSP